MSDNVMQSREIEVEEEVLLRGAADCCPQKSGLLPTVSGGLWRMQEARKLSR